MLRHVCDLPPCSHVATAGAALGGGVAEGGVLGEEGAGEGEVAQGSATGVGGASEFERAYDEYLDLQV